MQPTAYRGDEVTVHGMTRDGIKDLARNWMDRADHESDLGHRSAARIARGVAEFLYTEAATAAPEPRERGRFALACVIAFALSVVIVLAIVGAVAVIHAGLDL